MSQNTSRKKISDKHHSLNHSQGKDILSNLVNNDSTTVNYLERFVKLLCMLAEEMNGCREKLYDYKFVADRVKKYNSKLTNYLHKLRSEHEKIIYLIKN